MKENFEAVLDRCLAQIRRGEADVETCIACYPQYSPWLQGILETATFLEQAPIPEPRPEAMSRGRALLLTEVENKRSRMIASAPPWRQWLGAIRLSGQFPVPRWVGTVVVVLGFLLLSNATFATAEKSLPGEPLYPVKQAREYVRLALTFSDVDRANLRITLAERTVAEMAEMDRMGRSEEVTRLASRLAQHLAEAGRLVEAVGKTDDVQALRLRLEESAMQELVLLEETLETAPAETKVALVEVIRTSGKEYGQAP